MAGGPAAAPSPVPALPDVYAVIYKHVSPDNDSPSQPDDTVLSQGAAADRVHADDVAESGPPPSDRAAEPQAPFPTEPAQAHPASVPSGPRPDPASPGDRHGPSWALGKWTISRMPPHADDVPSGTEVSSASSPGGAGRSWALGEWTASWTPAEHAAAVSAVREAIGRGDVYQVNVVGHAKAPYVGDPLSALRRVAGLAGARYGGVLVGEGWALATASPETLVEVRDGRVITRPIKGTRPATADGRRELLASEKERAEHVMIVDLSRNDLSRLPGVGPVEVDELFAVREWSGLWQAESVVSAPIVGELDLASLLRALVPGGSVTGAPKVAALAEIARLEPVGRGVSMAAVGWIGPDHLDLGLTIRTVAVDGTHVHAWAGGGIVWDSDPQAEVAEAAAKLAPIKAALAGPPPATD
ncbi:chorismate-binding protein [Actinoplanes sp. Pm04-4]|uniref:Chorismate-binding protein n=1 Tax=Paractinoplanes pyxinae TaxID=2997416 RepID=A0ABT4BBW2_9ACTN|nr:chorismate-binding protein [Actinoplanes pyxinae]MCY1143305.1 chorismate-binding protein [Actinoplanes pyxinae]